MNRPGLVREVYFEMPWLAGPALGGSWRVPPPWWICSTSPRTRSHGIPEGFGRGGRRREGVADAEGKFVAGVHHAVGGCGCGEGMIGFGSFLASPKWRSRPTLAVWAGEGAMAAIGVDWPPVVGGRLTRCQPKRLWAKEANAPDIGVRSDRCRDRLLVHRHRLQRRKLLRPPRLVPRPERPLRRPHDDAQGRNQRRRLGHAQQRHLAAVRQAKIGADCGAGDQSLGGRGNESVQV